MPTEEAILQHHLKDFSSILIVSTKHISESIGCINDIVSVSSGRVLLDAILGSKFLHPSHLTEVICWSI